MIHERGTTYWTQATRTQARNVVRNAGISSELFTVALGRILAEDWTNGPHVYIVDTTADKAARITAQGCEQYSVKISSRPAGVFLDDLVSQFEDGYLYPYRKVALDDIVVMG